MTAFLDEVRLTLGVARYATNAATIVVPNGSYPDR